jgi:hypothetical protein
MDNQPDYDFNFWQSDLEGFRKAAETFVTAASVYKQIFHKQEHKRYYPFLDRILSAGLNTRDLAISLCYLHYETVMGTHTSQKYFGRVTALNSWQILDEVGMIIGQEATDFILTAYDKKILRAIKDSIAPLIKLKTEHYEYLKHIRHNLIAHKKDLSAIDRHQELEAFDHKKVFLIAQSIQKAQVKVIGTLLKIFAADERAE